MQTAAVSERVFCLGIPLVTELARKEKMKKQESVKEDNNFRRKLFKKADVFFHLAEKKLT